MPNVPKITSSEGIREWRPSTSYISGDIVYLDKSSNYGDSNFSNSIYLCRINHISDSSSFFNDNSKWKILNSGYEHIQEVASTTWQVDHSLGRFPTVMVTGASNRMIDAEIDHSNINRLFVKLSKPLTGRVYCT